MDRGDLKSLQKKVTLLRSEGKYKETIEECYHLLTYGIELNDSKSILTAHINSAVSYYCIGAIDETFNSIGIYDEVCNLYGDEEDTLNLYKEQRNTSTKYQIGNKIRKIQYGQQWIQQFKSYMPD